MKKIFFTILLFFLFISIGFTDELQIPFSCWPIELQKSFSLEGKKLDLSPTERTEESWGYVYNKGSEYILYTYHSISSEEFELIKKIVSDIELSHRKLE